MTTVYQVLRESVSKHAFRPFLHIPAVASKSYADGAIDFSYQEMADSVEAQQLIYRAAGYGLGHRVALVLDNRSEFFVHWFALNALGVSVVPVNSEMTTDEIAYLLDHSESCLVISLLEHIPAIAEALYRKCCVFCDLW